MLWPLYCNFLFNLTGKLGKLGYVVTNVCELEGLLTTVP